MEETDHVTELATTGRWERGLKAQNGPEIKHKLRRHHPIIPASISLRLKRSLGEMGICIRKEDLDGESFVLLGLSGMQISGSDTLTSPTQWTQAT